MWIGFPRLPVNRIDIQVTDRTLRVVGAVPGPVHLLFVHALPHLIASDTRLKGYTTLLTRSPSFPPTPPPTAFLAIIRF